MLFSLVHFTLFTWINHALYAIFRIRSNKTRRSVRSRGRHRGAPVADSRLQRFSSALQPLLPFRGERPGLDGFREDNPFPSISGRVCVHPCETGCNRTHIDTTVNIHAVERFIGDLSLEAKWPVRYQAKPSGKKVLVVGAGPAGLSAAYHLTRMGHKVEIFEGRSAPGGLLHYGIPSYRLPAEIRDGEIDRVLSMGVRLHLNHKVDDVLLEKEKGRFDAVFVAVGAQISKKEPITYTNAVPVWDAFQVLYGVRKTSRPNSAAV